MLDSARVRPVLLEFSAENFRSLRDRQSLDLRASVTRELPEVVRRPAGLEKDSHGVLPAAAVFGANASGKSSLFMAADFMRDAVLNAADSVVEGEGVLEGAQPFRFNANRRSGPVTLQVQFLLDGVRHEYGFTLQARSPKDELTRVAAEWLRSWPHGQRRYAFLRGDAAPPDATPRWRISRNVFGGQRLADDLIAQTRDDVLFLSLASQRNNAKAKAVVHWFNEQFWTTPFRVSSHTERRAIDDPAFLAYLVRLLRAADTGIDRVEVSRESRQIARKTTRTEGSEPSVVRLMSHRYNTRTLHRDEDDDEVALDLTDESAGTQRLFKLAGPVYDALRHGRCLWVDELDTAMHHWLVRALITLFQDPTSNTNGAQLLFTTHDAAVMDPTLLRRDQIWLVEKDAAQGSQLYSLADIEDKPRKGQPLFKSFLSGRFGGVPRLDEADILDWSRDKK